MKMEILNRKENKLLQRDDIEASVEADKTPSRKDIRAAIAAKLNAKEGLVVVDSIKQKFGKHQCAVKARVYSDEKVLKRLEQKHFLERIEPKKKGEQKPEKEGAGAAEKKGAKASETGKKDEKDAGGAKAPEAEKKEAPKQQKGDEAREKAKAHEAGKETAKEKHAEKKEGA